MHGSRKILAAVIVLGLAAFAVQHWYPQFRAGSSTANGEGGGTPAVKQEPVLTTMVHTAPAVREAHAVGSLLADESVTISPQVSGRVSALNFAEGTRVQKNQVLVKLDSSEEKAQLAESRASVKLQELKYRRAVDLHAKKAVSQQEVDEMRAALDEATAALALNRARLEKMDIRAPFNGLLGVRKVSVGAYLEAGDPVVELTAIDPIKVEFRLAERDAARLKTGQAVQIQVDAYPGQTFSGATYAVDPQLDVESRTVLVRARVPNPDGRLLPGMFVRVAMTLGMQADALWVPEQAVFIRGDHQYLYRVIDGRARLTRVEVGEHKSGQVQVVSGVSTGETIVSEGVQRLRDGVPVFNSPLPATEGGNGA